MVDTRNAVGAFGGPKLAAGATRNFNLHLATSITTLRTVFDGKKPSKSAVFRAVDELNAS